MRACILITVEPGKSQPVLDALRRNSAGRGHAGMVFGRWDIIGELGLTDMSLTDINNYITQTLQNIDGIRSTETLIGPTAPRRTAPLQSSGPSSCVMVRVYRGALGRALGQIQGIVGSDNAYAVTGRYDIVAFKHGSLEELTRTSTAINALNPTVKSTETGIAPLDFPVPM